MGSLQLPGSGDGLRLKQSAAHYTVDLSLLDLGDEFTLEVNTSAQDQQPPRRASQGTARFRRKRLSARPAGGRRRRDADVHRPGADQPAGAGAPIPELVEPASCVPGPGPNPEPVYCSSAPPAITVDEAGAAPASSSRAPAADRGAVSATFSTSDGTAIAGPTTPR